VTIEPVLAAIFKEVTRSDALSKKSDAELQAALSAYVAAARSTQPGIDVDDDVLVRYVAARSPNAIVPPVAHAGDVLLACACVLGTALAIQRFRDSYQSVIMRVLSRRRATSDVVDDATQIIYERLFVASRGGVPKIADYKGNGPLRSWVSSITATTLLMIRRAADRRRESSANDSEMIPIGKQADAELGHLKDLYKPELEEALVRALQALDDHERTLLRLHLGERMSIDLLGRMYGVNRATAARWLAKARAKLLDATRQEIRASLKVDDNECDSIIALAQSQLHVSIVRHLA
jgi:RNA polymerase sigma-70 factor, ECF subfamily